MSEEHQGYANYETFLVATEIVNDRSKLAYWLESGRECIEELGYEESEFAYADSVVELGKHLREHHEAIADSMTDASVEQSWPQSLLNAALMRVDWNEIADQIITKVREGVTA